MLDEAVARRVVYRWARFCAVQRPFTKDFELKDEWNFHLDRFRERNHGRGVGGKREAWDDHDGRGRRWEEFMASRRSVWFAYKVGMWREEAWKRRWQLWSALQALMLVALLPSWWTGVLLLVTVGGNYVEPPSWELIRDPASWYALRDWWSSGSWESGPSLPSEIVASAIAAKKQVNEGFVGRCVEFLTFSDSKETAETSEVED